MAAPFPAPYNDSVSYTTSAHPINSLASLPKTAFGTLKICGWKSSKIETHLRIMGSAGRNPTRLEASKEPLGLTQEFTNTELERVEKIDRGLDLFGEMKHRFLRFKKHQFLENSVHFQNLAQSQAPKFMVIACADSRVCPSSILGFQPGEAFTIRNVANLVPPFEVGNIFIIGHSCCGGIRALMSMQDEVDSSNSFIREWVIVGKNAKLRTKAATANLDFDQQCKHCEKESVTRSLLNLLSYPWVEKRVSEGILSLHGGYYDFVNCTFEKWTLEYRGRIQDGSVEYTIKDHSFWR
ncbi:beta carbonic anhydrase 5, chloroplastic isoform X2 [Magnolia sinica]|uniref:beta carbonic anhydrase 5, chloroplastic isoform X2 n=1 Tax=Magnolia sinica TaxID=86752 RepID=UPI0026584F27|nr:beta carbonic anhydrase 5, chloroplastic isoform X2 [Magnolia sinica]